MNYYRRYSGDYLRDTARLTLTEHGAYTLMLDYYYSDERALPADHDELYLMVRAMRAEDRKAVEKVLGMFFRLEPDGYHQKRVDHEIAVSKQARTNGKGGGRPPTGIPTGGDTGSGTGDITGDGGGLGHPPASSLQPPTTEPPAVQPPSARKTRAKSAFALPGWIPAGAWNDYAEMRQRIGKPMTDRAKELAIEELQKLCAGDSIMATAVLDQSVFKSWQGLFPVKINGSGLQDGAAEYLRQHEKEIAGDRIR